MGTPVRKSRFVAVIIDWNCVPELPQIGFRFFEKLMPLEKGPLEGRFDGRRFFNPASGMIGGMLPLIAMTMSPS